MKDLKEPLAKQVSLARPVCRVPQAPPETQERGVLQVALGSPAQTESLDLQEPSSCCHSEPEGSLTKALWCRLRRLRPRPSCPRPGWRCAELLDPQGWLGGLVLWGVLELRG